MQGDDQVYFGDPGFDAVMAAAQAAIDRTSLDSQAQRLYSIYILELRNCDWDGRCWPDLTEGEREAWRKVARQL